MVLLSVPGSIFYVSAAIAVDPNRRHSAVSSVFAGHHALPETVTVVNSVARRVTSGPVVVPTASGLFTCSFPLEIGHVNDADVVLGCDWLSACSLNSVGPYLDDPSAASLAHLPSGFVWSPYRDISGRCLFPMMPCFCSCEWIFSALFIAFAGSIQSQ